MSQQRLIKDSYTNGPAAAAEYTALGRLHGVERFADDNDDGGDEHEDGGDAEGEGVAGVVPETFDIFPDPGSEDGGDEGAGVDGEVEDGEEGLELSFLFRQLELVTAERRDAGLDTARADGYEGQADEGEFPANGEKS